MSPTSIVAYLVLFGAVAFLFLFVALLLGRLLRANVPTPEKLQAYECGEQPVGSGFVQFDLRFYVVALVFIIFEVEVALFFPAATIFGKSTQLMKPDAPQAAQLSNELLGSGGVFAPTDSAPAKKAPRENAPRPLSPAVEAAVIAPADARLLALVSMADLGVFFAVILVGFAYVWWYGDLNWVRAIGRPVGRIEQERSTVQDPEFRTAQETGLRVVHG
jgi:NADH-quinone oxidoreductase subunit A